MLLAVETAGHGLALGEARGDVALEKLPARRVHDTAQVLDVAQALEELRERARVLPEGDGAARLAEGRRLDLQKQLAALVVEVQELLGALVAAAEPHELALVLELRACA